MPQEPDWSEPDWTQPAPPPQTKPVSGADRKQALESGFYSGLSHLAGAIPDAGVQLYNLGKAGFGYATGLPFQVSDNLYPTGDAIARFLDKYHGLTPTTPDRPDDPASRYLATAGSVLPAAATAGSSAAGAVPSLFRFLKGAVSGAAPAMAGQAVAEKRPFQSDAANNAAAIAAQLAAGAAMPRLPGQPIPGREEQNAAITNWRQRGGVFPPATTNPSELNRTVESLGGKFNVQQEASLTNQHVTNETARSEIGLPPTPKGNASTVSADDIATAKRQAAPGYDAIKHAGQIPTDPQFQTEIQAALAQQSGAGRMAPALRNVKLGKVAGQLGGLQSFDGADAISTIRSLRDSATEAYRAGNAGDGAAYKAVATAIENQIERGLTARGAGGAQTLMNYRDARQQFAKIHSVEEARNTATGNVDARALNSQLERNEPLTGGLRDIATAAGQAPNAFKEPTHSTATSHVGLLGPILGAIAVGHEYLPESYSKAGMYAAAAAGALQGGRIGARKYALGPGQRNLIPTQQGPIDPSVLASFLASPAAQKKPQNSAAE